MIYYIKTYVVEYVIKILPVFESENISDNFIRNSCEIIYKSIYKNIEFDKEQVFKYKFLFYANAFYFFLNQEECIEPNMQDANYALKKDDRRKPHRND